MTDNEIIKALEQCETQKTCSDCPYFEKIGCKKHLYKDAYTLITCQQAEIKRLGKEVNLVSIQFQDLQERYEEAQSEIERLKEQIVEVSKTIKSVALKEFAERLKEQYDVYNGMEYVKVDLKTLLNTIDNLVKEMVGENND